MLVYSNPRDMGVPHDEWRPGQDKALAWMAEQRGWVLAEMPTGSGKTALPTALAHERSVMSLVATKSLQEENYRDIYGFDVLMGMANYPCIERPGRHCGQCYHADGGSMTDCSSHHDCAYVLAREAAKVSCKASLNYAYFLAAPWPREAPPQVLVCDEADELPHLVADHVGCHVTQKQQREWHLPDFPRIVGRTRLIGHGDPLDDALAWLKQAQVQLRSEWKRMKGREDLSPARQRCESLGMEVSRACNALNHKREGWYVRSDSVHFFCKPLTAKYHFPGWFSGAETRVLMSATIGGDGQALADALGIGDYAFLAVPNRWPPEQRPIYIPADAPRIGGKATAADYEHQADLVAGAIKERDPSWSGLILVTAKAEAERVADRLARRGLQDRVWVTPQKHDGRWAGTDKHAALWREEKKRRPGALCVTWNFWRGYDGLDEKIVAVMKTPFAPMGSKGSYEHERMMTGKGLYHWEAANRLAQGCGRTRRGREEDYGVDAGLVMVCDRNYKMVQKHLPTDFLEAIVS